MGYSVTVGGKETRVVPMELAHMMHHALSMQRVCKSVHLAIRLPWLVAALFEIQVIKEDSGGAMSRRGH